MTAEPIVIYSYKIDPQGVLECLRKLAPDLSVTPGPGGWSRIAISTKTGLFRKPSVITFGHDQAYYSGADFPRQMNGMMGYFSLSGENVMPRIMYLIQSFRFAITLFPQPQPELYLESSDDRLKYLFAVVKHLDGAIFVPSGLRDAAGRLLYPGQADPKAVMPGIFMQAPAPSELPQYQGGTAPNPAPPSADRVALRALCLGAASYRGMLEREHASIETLESTRLDDLKWIEAVGINAELEPGEQRLLQCPVGKGDAQKFTDAEWLFEAAAVLAWALGRLELPSYDVQVDVGPLGQLLGLGDLERGRAFLDGPTLRAKAEIDSLAVQLLGIHWRLRQHRLKPGAMDFETYSRKAWFGELPLDGIRFINRDLAIGEYAIDDAPADVLLPVELVVQERHKAINWLCGDSELYSTTDTQT